MDSLIAWPRVRALKVGRELMTQLMPEGEASLT
jgi:hypothetical protein